MPFKTLIHYSSRTEVRINLINLQFVPALLKLQINGCDLYFTCTNLKMREKLRLLRPTSLPSPVTRGIILNQLSYCQLPK
jgi:hypothetical protein